MYVIYIVIIYNYTYTYENVYYYCPQVMCIVQLQSISCHYASGEINFIDVKGSIQDSVEQELIEMSSKILLSKGVDPKFVTMKVNTVQRVLLINKPFLCYIMHTSDLKCDCPLMIDLTIQYILRDIQQTQADFDALHLTQDV